MNFYTLFTYKAKLLKIIDADTLDVELDLGFEVYKRARCRLANINAPELKTLEGKAAKQFIVDTIPLGSEILVESKDYDKYGRSLAIVHYNGVNINELLITNNHAIAYMVKT